MKKIVLLLMALLLSAVSFGQINVSPTTFHNGIKLPNVTLENTDSLATINGNGEIHYVSKDDVNSWILKVDGVSKKELKLGQALDIISGDNVTLSYSNGTVTISAAGKEYTAGSGLTLIGSEFNADFGTTAGTVAEGNDTRVVHGEAAYLWGDHAAQGYLTSFTETDPVYSASAASGVMSGDIANWDGKAELTDIPTDNIQIANGAGYLTSYTELDPVYSASIASGITAADVANWDAAEQNVQSDWNATSGDAEILNKPVIPEIIFEKTDTINDPKFDNPLYDPISHKAIVISGINNNTDYGISSIDFGYKLDILLPDRDTLGAFSFRTGLNNIVSGDFSVAFGGKNIVSGDVSVAFSSRSVISGDGSVIFGSDNIVYGDESAAFGTRNVISGDGSVTFGIDNTVSGDRSFVSGSGSTAYGFSSAAFGQTTVASGNYSAVFGSHTKSLSYTEFTAGAYNTEYVPISATAFDEKDRLLVVGNGEFNNNSDAFLINKRGEVYAPSMTVEMIAAPHLETDDSHYATVSGSNGKILVTKEYLMYWLKHLPSYDATKTQVLTNTSGTIGWTLK